MLLPTIFALLVPVLGFAALVDVKSSADGFVEALYVNEGDKVSKGDALIQLIDPNASLLVLELQTQIAKLEEQLNDFKCSIESEECLFVESALQRLRALMQKRQLMENDLQALMDDQKRQATLLKEGLVEREKLHAANDVVTSKKEGIAKVDEQIDAVEKQLVQGHQFEEVQTIVKQIQDTQDELQETRKHLEDLLLVAPQEGTVKEILYLAGDRVGILEPLLTIETTTEDAD